MKMDKSKKRNYAAAALITVTALILVVVMTTQTGEDGGGSGLLRPQSGVQLPASTGDHAETVPQDPVQTTGPDPTAGTDGTQPSGDTKPQPTDGTEPPVSPEAPVVLAEELVIEQVGTYSGMYVEDGSGEICPDIMMVVLRNGSEQDLQLARIEMTIGDERYHFQCTNLPAGEAAVLLDQDRKPSAAARPDQAEITLFSFFEEPMELRGDALEIRGQQGNLTVTNISGADIPGDICIYYKFHAADHYYGGITFRVTLRGGLKAGESGQLIAGHYSPDGCKIVQVTYGQ